MYPKPFEKLISHFTSLPSVGPKMAERLVLYLFKQDQEKLEDFAQCLEDIHKLQICKQCFHIAEGTLCSICMDPRRDMAVLCVVEEPLDIIAIERTRSFQGRYHVLGGVMEPAKKNSVAAPLHIPELLQRIEDENIKEVILATNPTTEGDLTALYLKKKLEPFHIKVTRIARGLATGGDIEYADEITLTSAITNRKDL
ncbi:MAG: recombination mediator RecR [Candidatus Moranbacteria bacterium]|nr:recombination mediator RecR [Candidatus Moranbacteria bacterium]